MWTLLLSTDLEQQSVDCRGAVEMWKLRISPRKVKVKQRQSWTQGDTKEASRCQHSSRRVSSWRWTRGQSRKYDFFAMQTMVQDTSFILKWTGPQSWSSEYSHAVLGARLCPLPFPFPLLSGNIFKSLRFLRVFLSVSTCWVDEMVPPA